MNVISIYFSEAWRRRRAGLKLTNRGRDQETSDRTDTELKAELYTDLRTEFENDPEVELGTEFENDPEVELGTEFENDPGDTSLRSWSEFKTDREAELGTEYENDPEVELGTEFQNDQEVELDTNFKDHEHNYKYYDKEVA